MLVHKTSPLRDLDRARLKLLLIVINDLPHTSACPCAISSGRIQWEFSVLTSVAINNLIFSLVFGLVMAPVGILLMMFLMREPALDAMAPRGLLGRLLFCMGDRWPSWIGIDVDRPANRFLEDVHDIGKC